MFITKLLASLLAQSTQKSCSKTTRTGSGTSQTISVENEGTDGASVQYETDTKCC